MRRRFSFLPFTMMASLAVADQPAAPEGGSPLCVWEIYVTLLAYGKVCGLHQDSDRRAALEEGADAVRRFIIDNSDITEAALAGARADIFAQQRQLKVDDADLCDPATEGGMGGFYRDFMNDQSPGELRAWNARFVSVPRDPRQGGCL
jgi:hypothetical protein